MILKEKRMSQTQLANAVNTTQNTIWRIAHGYANPSWALAERICEYLDCSLDELKGGKTANE